MQRGENKLAQALVVPTSRRVRQYELPAGLRWSSRKHYFLELILRQIQLEAVRQKIPIMRSQVDVAAEEIPTKEVLHYQSGYGALSPCRVVTRPSLRVIGCFAAPRLSNSLCKLRLGKGVPVRPAAMPVQSSMENHVRMLNGGLRRLCSPSFLQEHVKLLLRPVSS